MGKMGIKTEKFIENEIATKLNGLFNEKESYTMIIQCPDD